MPELPDLAILADALDAGLAGRPLTGATTPQSLVLRGTPAELAAFDGQLLKSVERHGKFLTIWRQNDDGSWSWIFDLGSLRRWQAR